MVIALRKRYRVLTFGLTPTHYKSVSGKAKLLYGRRADSGRVIDGLFDIRARVRWYSI